MDIIFLIAMYIAIEHAMKKHGGWKTSGGGGGGVIGLFLVSMFFLGIVRFPIYLFLYGWRFPFNPSDAAAFLTGIGAIAFWWAMIWWQVPARLLGRSTTPSKK